mmetsp:Transcript_55079/g.101967  ORF Transcript_55079/g.101967 Transcript_55079/m.101967 type:complete len:217 (-) Transcript_55079:606-1256(-)
MTQAWTYAGAQNQQPIEEAARLCQVLLGNGQPDAVWSTHPSALAPSCPRPDLYNMLHQLDSRARKSPGVSSQWHHTSLRTKVLALSRCSSHEAGMLYQLPGVETPAIPMHPRRREEQSALLATFSASLQACDLSLAADHVCCHRWSKATQPRSHIICTQAGHPQVVLPIVWRALHPLYTSHSQCSRQNSATPPCRKVGLDTAGSLAQGDTWPPIPP